MLTEQHQRFIDAFFENHGNATKAAQTAGFAPTYGYILVKKVLRKEILEAAEAILALAAPRAAFMLADAVDEDKTAPTNPLRLKAAGDILDRLGLSKKDKLEISAGENSPIFILPAKQEDA